jgi:hypothetical protein
VISRSLRAEGVWLQAPNVATTKSSYDGTQGEAGLHSFRLQLLDLFPSRRHSLFQRKRRLTTSVVGYGLSYQPRTSLVSRQYLSLFNRSQFYRQPASLLRHIVLSRIGHHLIKASSTGVYNASRALEALSLTRLFRNQLSRPCCWLSCFCIILMASSTAFSHISQRSRTMLESSQSSTPSVDFNLS